MPIRSAPQVARRNVPRLARQLARQLARLAAALLTLAAPALAQANPFEQQLANGLRVIVKEDHRAPTAVQRTVVSP